jgi:hypothetical protein
MRSCTGSLAVESVVPWDTVNKLWERPRKAQLPLCQKNQGFVIHTVQLAHFDNRIWVFALRILKYFDVFY